MALVPAICTQCGAQIEVDNTHEAGICKHCGTAFITERAIYNYNTVNHNTNYISADNINMGAETADQLADTGMKCIRNSNFELAKRCFEKIEQNYPSDWRGPWGYLLAITNNLTSRHGGTICKDKYENAYLLAPTNQKEDIKSKYDRYIQAIREIEKNIEKQALHSKYQSLQDYERNVKTELEQLYEQKKKLSVITIGLILGLLLLIVCVSLSNFFIVVIIIYIICVLCNMTKLSDAKTDNRKSISWKKGDLNRIRTELEELERKF